MENLTINYNSNPDQVYLILSRDGGFMPKGFEGCVNYLLGYNCEINLKFNSEEGNNHFTKEEKEALGKLVSTHNKLKSLENKLS